MAMVPSESIRAIATKAMRMIGRIAVVVVIVVVVLRFLLAIIAATAIEIVRPPMRAPVDTILRALEVIVLGVRWTGKL